MLNRVTLEGRELDRYTRFVLTHIDEDVRRSMTQQQFDSVLQAVEATKPRKHSLDLRGVIPLFFARYYFVILGGRDTRRDLQEKELDRRRNTFSTLEGLILAIVILIPLSALLIIGAYLLKVFLNIDVLPDQHFGDFLR